MKICPKCQSKFTDDSLNFCLQDGETLDKIIEDKTLEFDAGSFANEATITDNVEVAGLRETDQNRSVETVLSPAATGESPHVSETIPKKAAGFGFIAGILLSLTAIVVAAGAVYLVANYSDLGSGNTNSNANATKTPATRVLSDTTEVKVSASSTRKPDKGNVYNPRMAFDGNSRTGWCEGARGAGKGQWIAFDFEREVALREVVIQPGYFKTSELWRKNNRLKAVSLDFSDKSSRVVDFPDEMKEYRIDAKSIKTKSVFIKILDIYPGATDSKDTLISEVSFVVE